MTPTIELDKQTMHSEQIQFGDKRSRNSIRGENKWHIQAYSPTLEQRFSTFIFIVPPGNTFLCRRTTSKSQIKNNINYNYNTHYSWLLIITDLNLRLRISYHLLLLVS